MKKVIARIVSIVLWILIIATVIFAISGITMKTESGESYYIITVIMGIICAILIFILSRIRKWRNESKPTAPITSDTHDIHARINIPDAHGESIAQDEVALHVEPVIQSERANTDMDTQYALEEQYNRIQEANRHNEILAQETIRELQAQLEEAKRANTNGIPVDINSLISKYRDDPYAFEEYVASVFRDLGYEATVTPSSHDGGIDIHMRKDTVIYVAEVKLYAQGNNIGREKIQKLHSAMIDRHANKAIFVTTSAFSAPAAEYANKYNIDMINGNALLQLIRDAAAKKQGNHAPN